MDKKYIYYMFEYKESDNLNLFNKILKFEELNEVEFLEILNLLIEFCFFHKKFYEKKEIFSWKINHINKVIDKLKNKEKKIDNINNVEEFAKKYINIDFNFNELNEKIENLNKSIFYKQKIINEIFLEKIIHFNKNIVFFGDNIEMLQFELIDTFERYEIENKEKVFYYICENLYDELEKSDLSLWGSETKALKAIIEKIQELNTNIEDVKVCYIIFKNISHLINFGNDSKEKENSPLHFLMRNNIVENKFRLIFLEDRKGFEEIKSTNFFKKTIYWENIEGKIFIKNNDSSNEILQKLSYIFWRKHLSEKNQTINIKIEDISINKIKEIKYSIFGEDFSLNNLLLEIVEKYFFENKKIFKNEIRKNSKEEEFVEILEKNLFLLTSIRKDFSTILNSNLSMDHRIKKCTKTKYEKSIQIIDNFLFFLEKFKSNLNFSKKIREVVINKTFLKHKNRTFGFLELKELIKKMADLILFFNNMNNHKNNLWLNHFSNLLNYNKKNVSFCFPFPNDIFLNKNFTLNKSENVNFQKYYLDFFKTNELVQVPNFLTDIFLKKWSKYKIIYFEKYKFNSKKNIFDFYEFQNIQEKYPNALSFFLENNKFELLLGINNNLLFSYLDNFNEFEFKKNILKNSKNTKKDLLIDDDFILNFFEKKIPGIILYFRRGNKSKRFLEFSKLIKEIPKKIKNQVIGQDDQIDKIISPIMNKFFLNENKIKPWRSYLFVGPTGVGKTKIAELLGEYLFYDSEILIIDMSEYKSKDLLNPNEPLTKKITFNPQTIVVFDEIEKASQNNLDLLLQILSKGTLKNNENNILSFRNSIVICTTNLCSSKFEYERIKDESIWLKAASTVFRPEILARFENIIMFNHLNNKNFLDIFYKKLQVLLAKIKKHNNLKFKIKISQSVEKWIIKKINSNNFGARFLENIIENQIITPLIQKIIEIEKNKNNISFLEIIYEYNEIKIKVNYYER